MPVYPPQGWAIPQGTVNVLVNPGFEQANYNAWIDGNGPIVPNGNGKITNARAHTGTYSVAMINYGGFWQNVTVIGINVTILSFWTYCEGLVTTVEGSITITYADTTTTQVNIMGNGASSPWTLINVTGQLTGKNIAQVKFVGGMNDQWWIDDITLNVTMNLGPAVSLCYPPQNQG